MTGDDTGLLVVTGSVASQLEDLSCQVLEDSGQIDRSSGTNTLSVVALAEQTVDTTDGECQTGLGRTAVGAGSADISKDPKTRLNNKRCVHDATLQPQTF